MKTLSFKLEDSVYRETEQVREIMKVSRDSYMNDALRYYNRVQKRKIIPKLLVLESKAVSDESMKVLNEFENLGGLSEGIS